MPASHASASSTTAPRRRWRVIAIVAVLLLGSYAAGLAWVARRLEIDVQKSIHPVPAALAAQRSAE